LCVLIIKDHYHFFAIKKANPYISTEEAMPYATRARYTAAKKERFNLVYQTQAVGAAEVVSITLHKDCNLVLVSTSAGIATCRLLNASSAVVFDTQAILSYPVSMIVGTATKVLEITASLATTLSISQMASWGKFGIRGYDVMSEPEPPGIPGNLITSTDNYITTSTGNTVTN